MSGCGAFLLLLQGIVCFVMDAEMVRYLYPVITHIPLAIVLSFFSKKCLWSLVSVFTSYLCCQLRRWVGLLIVAICSGNEMMQNIVELIITFPLLLLLIKLVAPAVRSVSYYPISINTPIFAQALKLFTFQNVIFVMLLIETKICYQ